MIKSEDTGEVSITLSRAELVELNWGLDPDSQNLFYYAEPWHYNRLLEKVDKAYCKLMGVQSDDEE